ncbi:hypothetical protein FACS1894110_15080 [Spirochaetia bacterium]|nr:hypothetical protein FACS1894110_15080 [Spirochaetia bacterium]
MAIQQTIEVPASHRLTLEVPREIPEGKVILTFTPIPDDISQKDVDKEALAFAHGFVTQHITAFKELAK